MHCKFPWPCLHPCALGLFLGANWRKSRLPYGLTRLLTPLLSVSFSAVLGGGTAPRSQGARRTQPTSDSRHWPRASAAAHPHPSAWGTTPIADGYSPRLVTSTHIGRLPTE